MTTNSTRSFGGAQAAVLGAIVLVLCVPSSLHAQSERLRIVEEVLSKESSFSLGDIRALVQPQISPADDQSPVDAAAETKEFTNAALAAMSDEPATTSAPSGFASGLNDSFSNFLPLLEFAIDDVAESDDGRSLVVNFNPLKVGRYGALKMSASIAEPTPSDALLMNVSESLREAQKENITNGLDDFSDLTFGLSYGFQRDDRDQDGRGLTLANGPKLFGRNPKLYSFVLERILSEVQSPANSAVEDASDAWSLRLDELFPGENTETLTLGQLQNQLSQEDLRRLVAAEVDIALQDFNDARALKEVDYELLKKMIDNQPQIVAEATYRDPEEFIAPTSWSASLKYELGRLNLNRMLSYYKREKARNASASLRDAMTWMAERRKGAEREDRFQFAVTYKERDAWNPIYDYEQTVTAADGSESTVPQQATLDLDSSSEWCLRTTWSRTINSHTARVTRTGQENKARKSANADLTDATDRVAARLDLTAEYFYTEDDSLRSKNRFVAKLGYAIPLSAGASIPITLVYSDNPEFLGQPDHSFSTHFGISYNLDNLFARNSGN